MALTFSHVDLINIIGTGSYGRVFRASRDGESVAVKSIKLSSQNKKLPGIIRAEVNALRSLQHENIVRLVDVVSSPDKLTVYLILEYASCGDLRRYVESKGALSEVETALYFSQICSAVKFTHAKGFIHRDIKLENILLSENGVIRVLRNFLNL